MKDLKKISRVTKNPSSEQDREAYSRRLTTQQRLF